MADLELITQSDPYCVLKTKNGVHGSYTTVGKTETIDNNLNPKWVSHFNIEYFFSRQQFLLFEVWDDGDFEKDLIGSAEIKLTDIMMAPKQTYTCALVHKKQLRGTLKVKADIVNKTGDTLKF